MVFLEISQNSQENICARVSFFIKLQVYLRAATSKFSFIKTVSYSFLLQLLLVTKVLILICFEFYRSTYYELHS